MTKDDQVQNSESQDLQLRVDDHVRNSESRELQHDEGEPDIELILASIQAVANRERRLGDSDVPRIGPQWIRYSRDPDEPRMGPQSMGLTELDSFDDSDSSDDDNVNPEIIINPDHTSVILTIDGLVVPVKHCVLKVCGVRFFDDDFPFYFNPRLTPLVIGIIVIIGTLGGTLGKSHQDNAPISIEGLTSFTPSMLPSNAPSNMPLSLRRINITESLFSISGDVLLQPGSPQFKALEWILEEDGMNLTHNSGNLVQRYALMVLFYATIGEEWKDSKGFGSDIHECEWSPISCATDIVRSFILPDNNLAGELPKEIGVFEKLANLRFGNNKIKGSIPTEIGMLTKLEELLLNENELSGSIPHEITNLRSIRGHLSLHSNKLSGLIPTGMNALRSLQKLSLQNNQLTGAIPLSLLKTSALEQLRLQNNELTNSIPSEIWSLSGLKQLWLHENRFEGEIPSTLGTLSLLTDLRLQFNMLNSTIPVELGQLSNLNFLKLNDNQLTGTIPSSLANLEKLEELFIHNNMITGNVSDEMCDLSIKADCKEMMSCTCCDQCF